jgi:hypothetical protein
VEGPPPQVAATRVVRLVAHAREQRVVRLRLRQATTPVGRDDSAHPTIASVPSSAWPAVEGYAVVTLALNNASSTKLVFINTLLFSDSEASCVVTMGRRSIAGFWHSFLRGKAQTFAISGRVISRPID